MQVVFGIFIALFLLLYVPAVILRKIYVNVVHFSARHVSRAEVPPPAAGRGAPGASTDHTRKCA